MGCSLDFVPLALRWRLRALTFGFVVDGDLVVVCVLFCIPISIFIAKFNKQRGWEKSPSSLFFTGNKYISFFPFADDIFSALSIFNKIFMGFCSRLSVFENGSYIKNFVSESYEGCFGEFSKIQNQKLLILACKNFISMIICPSQPNNKFGGKLCRIDFTWSLQSRPCTSD